MNKIRIHCILVVHIFRIGKRHRSSETTARHEVPGSVSVRTGHHVSGEKRIGSGKARGSSHSVRVGCVVDDVEHQALVRQHRLQLDVVFAPLHELERGPEEATVY